MQGCRLVGSYSPLLKKVKELKTNGEKGDKIETHMRPGTNNSEPKPNSSTQEDNEKRKQKESKRICH